MSNPHITFDPSTIIQSRRFGCQTISGITARELLRPNAFIYQPKSSFTISPYDIGNNPLTPSKNLAYGDENFNNGSNLSNSIISIDNYDPRVPTIFTDELTLTAIKNIGIQQSDLFFPTNAILEKINGDKRYYENLLTERALKYREDVKKERQRILETTSNDYPSQYNTYSEYDRLINTNSQNYYRKGQAQRPSTGLRSLKPIDALEKAKLITEQSNEYKKRQDKIFKDFQYDKNNESQIQNEIFDEKRKRPSLYPQIRDENNMKFDDRENNKRKKEPANYISRPSSRKRVIRSSMSHCYTRGGTDLSVNEQKNATFLD